MYEGPRWRKSPIGSHERRDDRTRRQRLGRQILGGALLVLLLGSVLALRSQDEPATNRAVSSGGVRVDRMQPSLTFASNGATDRRESDNSLAGNAVLLIATPMPTPTPTSAITPLPTVTPTGEPSAPFEPPPTSEVPSDTGDTSVTIIGDSIALAAATDLRAEIPDLDFFAKVGLQVSGGIVALQERADAGRLRQTVVIDLGNNGTFTSGQFDAIMALVGDDRRIFFVNVNVPHEWGGTNNQLLGEKVAEYSNASLLDWYGASIGHPEYFAEDDVHLGPTGAKALANLLLAVLG
jgi:hypothetical protein